MKYVLLFLVLAAGGIGLFSLGRAGRAEFFRIARPMVTFGAIAFVVVAIVILIAYFGGQFRIL